MSALSKPEILLIGPYPQWDMQPLEQDYIVHRYWEFEPSTDLPAAIRAIATRGDLGASAELMQRLPQLEIVACYGVGTDAIDLDYAKANSIRVTSTPDVLTEDVADMGLALLLAVARKIPQGDYHVRSGSWRDNSMALVDRFCQRPVGLIGLGRIGRAIAKRVSGFGNPINYFDLRAVSDVPYTYYERLEDLAQNSDFLIATVSGGASTAQMVNRSVLQALGPNGYFVNVSRGSVVNEPDLLECLQNREIAGAGLDVFWNEPDINTRFLRLDNVVLQPHHASGTVHTRKAMGQLVRDNLSAHFAGQPLLTAVV